MRSATQAEHRAAPALANSQVANYRLLDLIGSGGMGEVWRAESPRGRIVALKRLRPDLCSEASLRERFAREIAIARQLRADNVVQVEDAGLDADGNAYLVMELLDGMSLAELIRRRAPLPQREAVDLIVQALRGVASAHAMGVIHRDLKPSNFFVVETAVGPCVKLLDFGIAKAVAPLSDGVAPPTLTETGAALGSMGYLAPEQARSSRSVDERADIWALGAILYRMLTSSAPFPAKTVAEYVAMIVTEAALPVQTHRSDVDPDLASVVARCLERSPEHRYGSLASLAKALQPHASESGSRLIGEIVALLPPQSESPSELQPSRTATTAIVALQQSRSDRPRRSATWAFTLFGVGLLGLGIVGWRMAVPEPAIARRSFVPAPDLQKRELVAPPIPQPSAEPRVTAISTVAPANLPPRTTPPTNDSTAPPAATAEERVAAPRRDLGPWENDVE